MDFVRSICQDCDLTFTNAEACMTTTVSVIHMVQNFAFLNKIKLTSNKITEEPLFNVYSIIQHLTTCH